MSRLSELLDRCARRFRTDRERREKSRKTLVAGVTACLCLLAGCSGSSDPAPDTNETANSTDPAPSPAAPSDPQSMYGDAPSRSAPPVSATAPRELQVIPSKAWVNGLAFSPDGTKIAAACHDGYFRIWDVAEGTLSAEIACPFGRAEEVCYSPNGKFLVGGSRRGGVWLIDPVSQKTSKLIELTNYVVVSIRFTPDLEHLAICWRGGRAALVSPRGETTFDIRLEERLRNLDVSPDGSELALCPEKGLIRIYRVADQQQVDTLDPQTPELGHVAYVGEQRLAVGGLDGQITVWDRTNKRRLSNRKLDHAMASFETHPDQRHLLLGTWKKNEGGAYLWDQAGPPIHLPGLDGNARSLAWDPSGRLAAAASNDVKIHIWDTGLAPATVEPLNETKLAALTAWKQRLKDGAAGTVASAEKANNTKWSKYEAADKKRIEQTMKDYLTLAESGDIGVLHGKVLVMIVSKDDLDRYFPKDISDDVWSYCRAVFAELISEKETMAARKSGEAAILARAKLSVVNLRTSELKFNERCLVNTLSDDLRLYTVGITLTIDGKKQLQPLWTFIVPSDGRPRMLVDFNKLASHLENKGKLPTARSESKLLTPLTDAGKSLLGEKAGQQRDDNGLKLPLRWCPPGKFRMGTDAEATVENNFKGDVDELFADSKYIVDVTLTAGFWLGETEVTQKQWKAVMGTEPWTRDAATPRADDMPATPITWEQASDFCRKLTKQERDAKRLPAGWEYNLPTEAEWEYACRAGTKTLFYFGNDRRQLSNYAWVAENSVSRGQANPKAHPVGKKKPNPWGLHDMLGNMEEWCRDYYGIKLPGGVDPLGPAGSNADRRVIRGGHFSLSQKYFESGSRSTAEQNSQVFTFGFRLALVRSTE